MKYNIFLITLMVLLMCGTAFSKNNDRTETEEFLYWQPGVKIEYKDYKSGLTKKLKNVASVYDIWTFSSITIQAVLDVPISTDNKDMVEKAYFAPVFRKYKSYTKYEDPFEFKIDQMNFDLAEICARFARKKLDSIFKANGKKQGAIKYEYFHCKIEMQENLWTLMQKFSTDYKVLKRAGAVERWDKMIASLLKQTEKYATKPIDCQRFISNAPVHKDYIKAPTVYVTEADRDKDLDFDKFTE